MAEIKVDITLENAHKVIDEIFKKYENNSYMLTRSYNYICSQMPIILDNIEKEHNQRIQRIEHLNNEQDIFIRTFLAKNQYYYVSTSDKFFYYDGVHYVSITEDDVLYNILMSINKDRNLLCWKQKTRIYIMKNIRENNLLKSVPESETIQIVLDALYPAIFETKNEAKYFLCVIGDNIFKKYNSLIHFIPYKAKHFINELNNVCQFLLGTNLNQSIRHKYYEHEYENCRIIKMNDAIKAENVWFPIININALDIVCVACHYSIRYESSDKFVIYSSNDQTLNDTVLYMKNVSQSQLINMFINDYLEIKQNNNSCERKSVLQWKTMQYIWKLYLESKNLPNIVFQQTLKNQLISQLKDNYNEETDSFIGIASRHMPVIKKFLQFWDNNIQEDEYGEYEISEICYLFKKWGQTINEPIKSITEKQAIDLITYFYPNIVIDREKYIYKIKCSLWDKQIDIQIALENMKQELKSVFNPNSPQYHEINICDAYVYYCKITTSMKNNEMIASKSYFEKHVFEYLSNYIIESKYIDVEWLMA
jgi:hypothetical protein